MRRVLKTFTADRAGKRAAEEYMIDLARLTTSLGYGATHGVYVAKTLPKGHPNWYFAPWAVFVTDRKSVRNRELTES